VTERQKLLHAIHLDPTDGLAHLAYADWLEENATSESNLVHAAAIRRVVTDPPRKPARLPVGGMKLLWHVFGDASLSTRFWMWFGSGRDPTVEVGGSFDELLRVGPTLFSVAPCRVKWSDGRWPLFLGGSRCAWLPADGSTRHDGSRLPPAVFALLAGGKSFRLPTRRYIYRTCSSANAGRDAALTEYLHRLAMGLTTEPTFD